MTDPKADKISNRLDELRAEFENGQTMLGQLEGQVEDLRTKLLRISGAIQVLEELKDTACDD